MTQRKAERLMNLTILLLTARHYITKEQIRAATEPYQAASDDAFDRMFDRDKEELRRSGVPIETGPVDPYFDDEIGYRIRRSAYELPEITFSTDEAALLGVAARVWQQAGLTEDTNRALTKLRAAGVDLDPADLIGPAPGQIATEAAFNAIWQATMQRREVHFDYLKAGDATSQRRRLRPYRVTSAQERWYVVGEDLDRGEPRMFRLSRIVGEVEPVGKPEAFGVPATVDLDALIQRLAPPKQRGQARLLVRPGSALLLRRRGEVVAEHVERGGRSWERIQVPLHDVDRTADAVRELGDAVLVESPPELREAVLAPLRALLAGSR